MNLTARRTVRDRKILESGGFEFGDGPYRSAAARIDTGRYLVVIQSMSRRDENRKMEIDLETEADKVHPVLVPAAPPGMYTWNSSIQYDMGDQVGIAPIYENKAEPLAFVDIRIAEPEKLARFGFSGYRKNDTSCQLLYKGGDRWQFNPGGGVLVYENGRWSADGSPDATEIASAPALLFPNSDFEAGDLSMSGWSRKRTATVLLPIFSLDRAGAVSPLPGPLGSVDGAYDAKVFRRSGNPKPEANFSSCF